jgi:hypothetical protein
VSPVGADGTPLFELTAADRRTIADFFRRYKQHESGKYSEVPGWGSSDDALAHVNMTHAFFRECRERPGRPCRIARAKPN